MMAKTKTAKKVAPKKEIPVKKETPSFEIPDGGLDVAMPEEFEFGEYKPLKKKEFQADHLYFSHRAIELSVRAEAFEAKAEEAKLLGSGKDRSKAKRLQKMQLKMEELRRELEEQGIDVDELLKD